MSGRSNSVVLAVSAVALALFGCQVSQPPEKSSESKQIQELVITLGGFIKDHPEGGKLEGVCGTDYTRNVLDCDIYNGLLDWTVTEITLEVGWAPYQDENRRFYRESVSIGPMKTSHVNIRLGMQVPPDDIIKHRIGPADRLSHWSWLIAGAKGYRGKAKPMA